MQMIYEVIALFARLFGISMAVLSLDLQELVKRKR